MKTSAPASARPSTTSGPRLRRLAVVGLVAPVVALAACSGDPAVTADPTAPAGTTPSSASSSAASTAGTTSSSTTSAPTASPTSAAVRRTNVAVKASLKDPVLGHSMRVTKLSRNMPYPNGNPVASANFEIVGVYVVVSTGDRYSATVTPAMFSLRAVPSTNQIFSTTEFRTAFKGSLSPVVKRNQTRSGWLFFKMDKGAGKNFVLAFHRPPYVVSTTDTTIPTKAIGVTIRT